jgi:hypothetical protein
VFFFCFAHDINQVISSSHGNLGFVIASILIEDCSTSLVNQTKINCIPSYVASLVPNKRILWVVYLLVCHSSKQQKTGNGTLVCHHFVTKS